MKTRTLKDGRAVTLHDNHGLRKRCACARRAWAKCEHDWHFSFKWRKVHHRFPLDRYASGRPVRSKDEARAEADRLRAAIRDGAFPPAPLAPVTTPADLTFKAFAEKWRERARTDVGASEKVNDAANCAKLAACVLRPGETLGDRHIGSITEDDLEAAFQTLAGRAASTWNKYRQTVLHLQRWGVKKGYLTRPWLADPKAIPRRKGAKRDRRLVPDTVDDQGRVTAHGEERRLLAKASAWLQRLIIAAIETGARRGELLSLLWGDVSLSRGVLTFRAENTKTDEARTIPISPRLRGVLDMVRHDPAGRDHPPSAYVFGDTIGGKVADPKKAWAATCTKAGITGLHFHDLRHEAGSRLLEQGWPLHHVSAMLGHADVKTTSIYLNVTATGLQDSMRRYGTAPAPSLPDVAHEAETERPPAVQQTDAVTSKPLVN